MNDLSRIVCHFSCGAASAVADALEWGVRFEALSHRAEEL
jgi:hypothetical protein